MRALIVGHKYELNSFEGGAPQVLQFIDKVPVTEDSPELRTIQDGTTNEEVLEVLLDRCNWLQKENGSRETAIAATKLEEALLWFRRRTELRRKRGVEGKNLP